jgi:hypothetical protein
VFDQQVVDTWVNGQLAADAALLALLPLGASSIFNQIPPAGTLPPYVVFNSMPAPDLLTNGNIRVMATYNCSVQIVIFDPDSGKPYADGAAALFDADMFTQGVSQNGYWITCHRTKGINLAPNMRDRLYRYVGGIYEVKLRPQSQPS